MDRRSFMAALVGLPVLGRVLSKPSDVVYVDATAIVPVAQPQWMRGLELAPHPTDAVKIVDHAVPFPDGQYHRWTLYSSRETNTLVGYLDGERVYTHHGVWWQR